MKKIWMALLALVLLLGLTGIVYGVEKEEKGQTEDNVCLDAFYEAIGAFNEGSYDVAILEFENALYLVEEKECQLSKNQQIMAHLYLSMSYLVLGHEERVNENLEKALNLSKKQ